MKTKCDGCGANIQTTDPNKIGYIRSDVYIQNPENFLCERCFRLKHYNELIKVPFDENDFTKNINTINKSKALVVNVIDAFDIEGTIMNNINELFPNNKVLIIANKYDLYLRSNKPTKIKKIINEYLEKANIKTCGALVTSATSSDCPEKIFNALKGIFTKENLKEAYFFGMTNVGKSSLIKRLISYVQNDNKSSENKNLILVSNVSGTTLGTTKIAIDKYFIYDTPGMINKKQISYYLKKETLDYVLPLKFIRPKVFQLNPLQTLFIAGLVLINYLEGEKNSFICYFSNRLKIHRTKYENSEYFYEVHKDDILVIPDSEERENLGELKSYIFDLEGDKEVVISGLGFFSVIGKAKIEVKTFENVLVTTRKKMI